MGEEIYFRETVISVPSLEMEMGNYARQWRENKIKGEVLTSKVGRDVLVFRRRKFREAEYTRNIKMKD